MEKHFVILSEGAYSDYSPKYYMGDNEITQAELTFKAKEIGDLLKIEWEKTPTRPHQHHKYCLSRCDKTIDYYDSTTNEITYKSDVDKKWQPMMESWLKEKGFEKIPDNIPEINLYYDIPTN